MARSLPPPVRMALVLLCLGCGAWSWLEDVDEEVAAGNRAFAEGQYERAQAAYERALERAGEDPRILYDLSVALYRWSQESARTGEGNAGPLFQRTAGALARAAGMFAHAAQLAAARGDTVLAANAHVGCGNALYRAGRYAEAIDAYKSALLANPGHDDARYNLELAQERLDEAQSPDDRRDPGASGAAKSGQDGAAESGRDGAAESGRDGAAESGQDGAPESGRDGAAESGQDGAPESGQDGGVGERDSQGTPTDRPSDGSPERSEDARAQKLEALERRSRDLWRDNLSRGQRGTRRGRVERDW